eukprot:CAMPEP_0195517322 /NCGR_PEP_ID=MMETSP0794_2-20130614/10350_1 /TAXON_ID=515487 /ORGANISM="Stephanopyxis turris, Strain CCMP 815" /LENGTH=794 /DNA_ID=CAMNT_0040646105 /DNA_START=128 /DNA_END=2512 /DNA_ORIENTATION=+
MSAPATETPTPVADAAPVAPDTSVAAPPPSENVQPVAVVSAGAPGGASQQQPFHSASLYVGDLAPDVSEGLLFEIFNAVGPVASIRVCRDAVTRRSLGYAYINFHQIADAERALDTMNYTMIKTKPCRIMWSQRDPSLRRSGVGNIFVKNLNESITNKDLYDTFSLFGNILSCKVVTDPESSTSKGYGYVHYETAEAANAAIDKLDGMLIDGQEVQVGHFMRRNERPGQSDWTNCFVKNIPLEWDDAKLQETFAAYGEVLSASVAMGFPKQFRKKKAATKKAAAAKEAAKKEGDDAKKDEADAEKKSDDKAPEGDAKSAPNPAKSSTDTPTSAASDAAAPADDSAEPKAEEKAKPVADEAKDSKEHAGSKNGGEKVERKKTSLGYGFVSFLQHESAVAAVEQLNTKKFSSKVDGEDVELELYVGRAQKKVERERELRAKFDALKIDRISKFQGVNLYVKNLDDNVTDDQLRDEFAVFGTITSARVMKDMKDGRSRGFGFVCYSSPEEATRAVNEMNGKLIAQKPIFVALAQRKEVRRAQLEAQHSGPSGQPLSQQPNAGMMRGPMGGQMGYPGAGGMHMYMPRAGPGGSMQPTYPMPQMMMGQQGQQPRPGQQPRAGYPMMQQQRGGYPMPAYGPGGQQPGGAMGGQNRQQSGRGGGRGGAGGRGPAGAPQMQQPRGPAPNAPAGHKFNNQARNAAPPAAPAQPAAAQVSPPVNESLTASALASASPEMQKNMIGERLYPLIHASQPDLAGKITGMLLEMDNSELLHLLESPDALKAKITEALQVLEAHNTADE